LRRDIEFQVRTQNGFPGAHGADRAGFAAATWRGPVFAANLEEIERPGEVLAVVFGGGAGAAILL